jgi:hypothetical protein
MSVHVSFGQNWGRGAYAGEKKTKGNGLAGEVCWDETMFNMNIQFLGSLSLCALKQFSNRYMKKF